MNGTKQKRSFHIGDILTITTDILVSPRLVEGIYDILNYMTGDDLMTHQLPRAAGVCKPHLLSQHPQLAQVDASGVNENNWQAWLAEQVAEYGEYLPVEPLGPVEYERKDPLDELREMRGNKPVILVSTEDDPAEVAGYIADELSNKAAPFSGTDFSNN
jgi:hypothetical protein